MSSLFTLRVPIGDPAGRFLSLPKGFVRHFCGVKWACPGRPFPRRRSRRWPGRLTKIGAAGPKCRPAAGAPSCPASGGTASTATPADRKAKSRVATIDDHKSNGITCRRILMRWRTRRPFMEAHRIRKGKAMSATTRRPTRTGSWSHDRVCISQTLSMISKSRVNAWNLLRRL